jgi:sigma-E factor negative regulatory protein RseC
MIVETGRVIKAADGKAMVEIARSDACATCHADCALKSGQRTMFVEVNDPIGVHENQYAQLSMQSASALRAAFVVYVIPVMALVVGVLLGEYLGATFGIRNGLEILFGFGFLGLSLIWVKLYNNRFKQNIHNLPIM